MFFLTEPSTQYKDQYIAALREFQHEGKHLNEDVGRINANFDEFVQRARDLRDRSKVAPNLVPMTDYWLVEDGEFIGRLSVRHELNEFLLKFGGHIGYEIRPSKRRQGYGKVILRLGLEQARQIGLRRALVTCDENNIGSKKIIESNGGQFENAMPVEGSRVKKLRYWIDLTP
jgi:predicted acetyltransferase